MSAVPITAAPHVHVGTSLGRTMGWVMVGLVPATAWSLAHYGWPALNLLLLSMGTALVAEGLALRATGRPVKLALRDGSALVTGWLLALTLPPWAPWWIAVVGAGIAIVLGKQVFGGLGQNPFNPAMVARVVLLISFPLEMTAWIRPRPLFEAASPGFLDGLGITFLGSPPVDTLSGATALDQVKTELARGLSPAGVALAQVDPQGMLLGVTRGSLGEGSALLLAAGGVLLLLIGVIRWPIPAAMLGSVAAAAGLFHALDPGCYPGVWFHLFSGGLMLGAFFIATDPVTSPVTLVGQFIFGAGCGLLTFVIRTWGGYPEGVAFAVLLMNAATPLMDHYIRPRIFGRTRSGASLELAAKSLPGPQDGTAKPKGKVRR